MPLQPSLLGTSLLRRPARSDFMSSENDSGYSTSYKSNKQYKENLIPPAPKTLTVCNVSSLLISTEKYTSLAVYKHMETEPSY